MVLPPAAFEFPDVETANPHGLLALGGDFRWDHLVRAYAQGIFPWSSAHEPIAWFAPDPRSVLPPSELRVQRSMRPLLNRGAFRVTYDRAFSRVLRACAKTPRPGQDGTWLRPDLQRGLLELHRRGFAHSVEAWDPDTGELVGGLYGIAIGRVFAGESMFAHRPNASKYAFVTLARALEARGYWLIDCQQSTAHLERFGARDIPRAAFTELMARNRDEPTELGPWTSWEE